jgi:hypothetical protein
VGFGAFCLFKYVTNNQLDQSLFRAAPVIPDSSSKYFFLALRYYWGEIPSSGITKSLRFLCRPPAVMEEQSRSTNSYQGIRISDHARAILGNVYNFNHDLLASKIEKDNTQNAALSTALYYEGMDSRRAQLDLPAIGSLDWIWSSPLADWFKGPGDLFWISGKPGSGKSTLVKYLAESKRTRDYLGNLGSDWVVVYFYFDFRAGRETPNALEGLLRSFLYQLCESFPESIGLAVHILDPNRKAAFPMIQDLRDTISKVLAAIKPNVCAFIDGLDEYLGDMVALIQSLDALRNNTGMKICLASRPGEVLSKLLKQFPAIIMEDHNSATIRAYLEMAKVTGELYLRTAFQSSLIQKICIDANGVVLWARLAMEDVIQGCMHGESIEGLYRRLDGLPLELEAMYERCLNNVNHNHKPEVALILFLIDAKGKRIMSGELFRGWRFALHAVGISMEPFFDPSERQFEARICALLGGLIELVSLDGEKEIRLIHKTFQSHLESSDWVSLNIPSAFKRQYPHPHWLHMYADVLEQASDQLEINSDDIFRELYHIDSTTPFSGNPVDIEGYLHKVFQQPNWKPWFALVQDALHSLSEAAQDYEDQGYSSYSIIHRALHSPMMLLYSRTFLYYYKFRHTFRTLNIDALDMLQPRMHDLCYSIQFGLGQYIIGRLEAQDDFSNQEKDRLIQFALTQFGKTRFAGTQRSHRERVWKKEILKHPERALLLGPYAQTVQVLFRDFEGINGQHLCILMDRIHEFSGRSNRAINFRELISILDTRLETPRPGGWPWEHGNSCQINCRDSGMLYHWAQLRVGYFSGYNPDALTYNFLSTLLEFLLANGESVERPCYPGGNAIHAIFERTDETDFWMWNLDFMYIDLKFICLINAGADPWRNGKNGNAWQYAVKLKQEFASASASGSRRVTARANRTLTRLERIISYMDFYWEHHHWPEEEWQLLIHSPDYESDGEESWEEEDEEEIAT